MSNYQITSKLSIYGVDFSGAKDACKKIWICKGTNNDNILQIDNCCRLRDELRKGSKRDQCFAALKNFIQREKSAAFGLDFPFGLPQTLLNGADWEIFIRQFPKMYNNPEQFRGICLQKSLQETGNKELKRRTDEEKQSPFCAYNLRIYKQTYYGICNVLYPLVRDNSACILPMQHSHGEKNLVLEICPSSTLRQEGLPYSGYKGKKDGETKRQNRAHILDCMIKKGLIKDVSLKIREIVLNDTEGDALDSIVAAVATFRATNNRYQPVLAFDVYKVEGYIYS